jgi:predicted nucleotidyltransferase
MTPTPPQSPRPNSVQPVQNSGESREHAKRLGQAPPSHGLPERTVAEIRQCLQGFPQIRWVKLYGSRALGTHRRGSDIDLAFSAPDDCSAELREALDQLPTPYLFDVTHVDSLQHPGLREHIARAGRLFP